MPPVYIPSPDRYSITDGPRRLAAGEPPPKPGEIRIIDGKPMIAWRVATRPFIIRHENSTYEVDTRSGMVYKVKWQSVLLVDVDPKNLELSPAEVRVVDTGISVRAFNVIETILGENPTLAQLASLSRRDLFIARGCGKTTMAEITRILARYGLRLQ